MLRRLAALGVSTALLSAGLAAAPVAAVPAEAGWTQARAVAPRLTSGMTTRTRTVARPAPVVSPASAYEREVLRLVNVERSRAGLRPLALDTCAQAYALKQNLVIALAEALTHQDLSRVLSGCGARGVGENVAYGHVTASEMMRMWMASSGHRANILRASYTHLGVSATRTASGRWYGTQVFLTRS